MAPSPSGPGSSVREDTVGVVVHSIDDQLEPLGSVVVAPVLPVPRRQAVADGRRRRILQRIHQVSEGLLEVNQGSLYPALQRLEERGLIKAEWRRTAENRRARYYELTSAGRKALGDETAIWRRNEA